MPPRLPVRLVLAVAALLLVAAPAARLAARQVPTPAAADSAVPQAPPTPADGADLDPERFAAFVADLKAEAARRGISEAVAAQAFDGLEPLPVVVQRDRGQAEAVLSIDTYVRRRLTPATIRKAQRMAVAHRDVLLKAGKAYGIQPRYLVAVWGLESNFGAFTGVRPTVQALATLAFEGRRDGTAAVHALELPALRRRLRRRRTA